MYLFALIYQLIFMVFSFKYNAILNGSIYLLSKVCSEIATDLFEDVDYLGEEDDSRLNT